MAARFRHWQQYHFWLYILLPTLGWLIGLFLGCQMFQLSDSSFYVLIRSALMQPISLSGLVVSAIIPFVLSASAVYFHEPLMLALFFLIHSAGLSWIGAGILGCFGSAGWLFFWLMLFSQCTAGILELWCWLHSRAGKRFCFVPIAISATLLLLAAVFEYYILSPFGILLIELTKG